MYKQSRGFTIVELLIVIVVIAVLAAVTVVAYNGVNARANGTAIQSDLRNIAAKVALNQTDTGSSPAASLAGLTAAGFDVNTGQYGQGYYNGTAYYNLLYCRGTDNVSFALVAWSKSNAGFVFRNGSVTTYAGVPAGMAIVCPAVGLSAYTGYWIYSGSVWQIS